MTNAIRMTDDYNQKGQFQHYSSECYLPVLKKRLQAMHKAHPERFEDTDTPFTIADLGCATGVSSINPCKTLIDAVREISPAMPIIIYLADLPQNNFTTAIMTLNEGLKQYEDVLIYCIGKTIYKKLFPPNSMDFIYSFSTVHWLEEVPATSSQTIYSLFEENVKTEEGQIWAAAAKKHWKKFLILRQEELRTGGQFVASAPGLAQERTPSDQSFYDLMTVIRESFTKVLTKYDMIDVNEKMVIPAIVRREEDWTGVFREEKEIKLKLAYYEYAERPYPYTVQYHQDNDHEKMVNAFKDFIVGFSYPYFEGTLANLKVDKALADKILTEVYESELKQGLTEWAQPPGYGIGISVIAANK